jgi:predicted TIM-barrel fold metal-dependent hydrolase
MGANDAWLAQVNEVVIEPELPICDAHHHLWTHREGSPVPQYLLEAFLSDINTGHHIVSTVFVDSNTAYRTSGPKGEAPIGEVVFANDVAERAASGRYGKTRVASAVISHADMRLGSGAGPVLDAMIAAAPKRFRGIRHAVAYDEDPALPRHRDAPRPFLLGDETFRQGISEIDKRGLIYECYLWHPQLPELADLARAFPTLTIVLNHCGGPIGVGHYQNDRRGAMELWQQGMTALAACENVVVKIGGVNMIVSGHEWHKRDAPPGSDEMLDAAGPYVEYSIARFGVDRCLFESNYPSERRSCGYGPLWNFFKKLTKGFSAEDKARLYHDNAVRIYRIS